MGDKSQFVVYGGIVINTEQEDFYIPMDHFEFKKSDLKWKKYDPIKKQKKEKTPETSSLHDMMHKWSGTKHSSAEDKKDKKDETVNPLTKKQRTMIKKHFSGVLHSGKVNQLVAKTLKEEGFTAHNTIKLDSICPHSRSYFENRGAKKRKHTIGKGMEGIAG